MVEINFISWWFAIMLVSAYAGMFAHFLKKNIKGETATEIKNYFKDNLKSTIIAAFLTTAAALGYIALAKDGLNDLIALFFIGYAGDSISNKYEPEASIKIGN